MAKRTRSRINPSLTVDHKLLYCNIHLDSVIALYLSWLQGFHIVPSFGMPKFTSLASDGETIVSENFCFSASNIEGRDGDLLHGYPLFRLINRNWDPKTHYLGLKYESVFPNIGTIQTIISLYIPGGVLNPEDDGVFSFPNTKQYSFPIAGTVSVKFWNLTLPRAA